MDSNFLFVYVTLRRNCEGKMHPLLAESASFICEATYQGKLYKISDYVGAVPSDDRKDRVKGELYLLKEKESLFIRLDEYEECKLSLGDEGEFIRTIVKVCRLDGNIIDAWIYLYNRPTSGLEIVQSGDYLTG